jgi:glycosyltransferase involved in cell wall biosynthesis
VSLACDSVSFEGYTREKLRAFGYGSFGKISKLKAHVLYITYDGLLDPLGQSQILPYFESIAARHGGALLVSFEKHEKLRSLGEQMKLELESKNISWYPTRFTSGSWIVWKIWDFLKMILMSLRLVKIHQVRVVHARGHLGAITGGLAKFLFGSKLIFDFRGLWVDERVDKGGWNLSRVSHRLQFTLFKMFERAILSKSDHVVVLTNAVVAEVVRIGGLERDRITVIPCCADFDLYKLACDQRRIAARAALGIQTDDIVIGYLGSVGNMYLVDRFLTFVRYIGLVNPFIQVLVLTPDIDLFVSKLNQFADSEAKTNFIFRSASRDEVAMFAPAFNFLVSFIKPSYARIGASPTKIAEAFAMGIPVVTNHGIGDLSELVPSLRGGVVLNVYDDEEMRTVARQVMRWDRRARLELRDQARIRLGLEVAQARYREVYDSIGIS